MIIHDPKLVISAFQKYLLGGLVTGFKIYLPLYRQISQLCTPQQGLYYITKVVEANLSFSFS